MTKLPELLHVGHVVRDVEAALARAREEYGVDQAGATIDLTPERATLHGEPVTFTARYAFAEFGNTQWEFIEHLDGDSPYSRFLAEHGEGVHHLAFIVDSIDDHLAQLERAHGAAPTLLVDALLPGGVRFVYVEGTANGAVIELIERDAQ